MKRQDQETLVLAVGILALSVCVALCGGCASIENTMNKAVSTAAITAKACYEGVDTVNEAKKTVILGQIQAGNIEGAETLRQNWLSIRGAVLVACTAIDGAARGAKAAIPLIVAGRDKAGAAEWIARLLAAALDVKQALSLIGVNLGRF